MSKVKVEFKPSYVQGGAIAVVGLIVAWVVSSVVPEWLDTVMASAITGGFGAAAASRIWPGLPLKQMYQYAPAVAVYGAAIGLVTRI
jgi:Na+/glutamate symporter